MFGLTRGVAVVAAGLIVGAGAAAAPAVAAGRSADRAAAAGSGGTVVAVTPSRVLDTRTHLGASRPAARATVQVPVLGRGGVPTTGVGGVLINMSAVHPAASGYLTLYADGRARPGTSSVNFAEGVERANLVVVPVGTDGKIAIYNGSGGGVDLVGDVEGYYRSGSATQPGTLTQGPAARLYDSRSHSPLGPNAAVPVAVAGRDGVPTTGGVTALVNVVVTQYSGNGRIETYGSGGNAPNTTSLRYLRGTGATAALAFVPVASNGNIELRNVSSGTTDVVVDLVGYVRAGTSTKSGTLASAGPKAIVADAFLGARATRAVHVLGTARVPSTGVGAVLLDVSSVEPVAGGYFTLWPAGVSRPATSTDLWEGTIPTTDLVLAKVGTGGNVEIYNGPGVTTLEVDAVGFARS